jgi:hypothetical protein
LHFGIVIIIIKDSVLFEEMNVFTSLLGLVIVSHLSPKGSRRFTSPQDEATHSDEVVWIVFCDGLWGSFEAAPAAINVSPSKVKKLYVAKLQFQCTNNIAEYKDLLLGLRKLKAMEVRRAILKSDSQVITGQVDKSSNTKNSTLEKYLDKMSEEWRLPSKGSQ